MASSRGEARIFVKNLPPDIKEKEVRYIFSKYGTVLSVDIIMWPQTPSLSASGCIVPVEMNLSGGRRERPDWQACAFVAYGAPETALTAIRALHNVYRPRSSSSEPLSVCAVRSGRLPEPVQAVPAPSAAVVERAAEKAAFAGAASAAFSSHADKAPFSAGPGLASATASYVAEKTRCKLFVGNLFADLPKDLLSAVFSEYGRVVNVHVMTGKSKFGSACAFVELATPQEAEIALRAMHQKFEPRIGSGSAPITVTYFQSQSSGKAGQAAAAAEPTGAQRGARFGPY